MGAVYEASAAAQHCNSPVCQVGTNKFPMPRPSVPTGDPGEGEAQVAPPGSLMHCEPCALQMPGTGLPGEADPLVVRGGGGTFEVLGAGQAAEGQAGGRPAAPAGERDRPPQEADPDPEGRGFRVLRGPSSACPSCKGGGHIARRSLLHIRPFLGQD